MQAFFQRAFARWGGALLCFWLGLHGLGCARPVRVAPPPTAAGAKPGAAPSARNFASPYGYEWFLRAELLRGRGQLAAACEAYRAALAGADEDPYVLARLATALDERGDHGAARATLREAQQLEPNAEVVWLAEAELARRAGAFDLAYAALERAEQSQPLSPRGPLQLAALLRARGYPERADAVLLRFEARSLPGTAGALAARLSHALSGADARRIWQATLPYRLNAPLPLPAPRADGLAQPALLRDAARRLWSRGRPAQALRLLELVPEQTGEDDLRLSVLTASGRYGQAELWLRDHPPQVADDWLAAAQVYLALGRFDAAAESLEAAGLAPREAGEAAADSFRTRGLPLMAAEIALARGHFSRAARLFAQVPPDSADSGAARQGLRRALEAQGLAELAGEVVSEANLVKGWGGGTARFPRQLVVAE